MILSYAEASAYAIAIAKYFITMGLACIIFVWAWRNLVTYFKWHFEDDEADEAMDTLESIHDELIEIRSEIAYQSQEPRVLEIAP